MTDAPRDPLQEARELAQIGFVMFEAHATADVATGEALNEAYSHDEQLKAVTAALTVAMSFASDRIGRSPIESSKLIRERLTARGQES